MSPPDDADRAAWEERIRSDERDRGRNEQLSSQFTELRSLATSQHSEVMTRLSAMAENTEALQRRVEGLERRETDRERIAGRFGAETFDPEDAAALRPMAREWRESKAGKGLWEKRLTLAGLLLIPFLIIVVQHYWASSK